MIKKSIRTKTKSHLLTPVGMLITGLALGIIIRLLDIYTTNLGNIFSQIAVWVLLGTIISIYSATPKAAMFHILPFCVGMILTYYVTAIVTNGVYNKIYIFGWSVFALCSPLLAYIAWMTKCKGVIPKMISIGIIVVSLLSSIVLFHHLRFYDFIITSLLIYFLFFKKIDR